MLLIALLLAFVLYVLQFLVILLREYRHPSKSMAWMLIAFILPVVGFILYIYMAGAYKQRQSKLRSQGHEPSAAQPSDRNIHPRNLKAAFTLTACGLKKEPRLMGLLLSLEAPITSRNKVTVLSDAASTYKAIFAAIEQARHFVHLEYYTVRDDGIGRELKELLLRKAREGVEIRLIVDGLGSHKLSKPYMEQLRQGGVQLYVFLPPLLAFLDRRINYRNHRKIVVTDGKIGFLGGINFGDEYLGQDPKLGYWRDTHIKLEGEVVDLLHRTFLTDWAFVSGTPLQPQLRPSHAPTEEESAGEEHVQVIASGPDAPWDTVHEVFFSAMAAAKERIYMTTPYFIPDPGIASALITAARSGVDVRLIIPAVPDSKIVYSATLSYVEPFLQAGIRIYQYRKGFMHAKILIVDQLLGTVGTANMDMRSLFSNFEIVAVLYERESIKRLNEDFQRDLTECVELNAGWRANRTRAQRGMEVIARLLSPLF